MIMEGKPLEQYQIGPWEHLIHTVPPGTVLEQYVPPEVEEVARHVMSQYDMSVSSMVLITSKPDKGGAIWRIDTDKGPEVSRCCTAFLHAVCSASAPSSIWSSKEPACLR